MSFNENIIFGVCLVVGTAIYLLYRTRKAKKSSNEMTLFSTIEDIHYLTLVKKEVITHDTLKFTFKLPTDNHQLGLPLGCHLCLYANIGGEEIKRPYTPVTSDKKTFGITELVIKIYRKNGDNPGGKMSQYVENLEIGETMKISGPKGRIRLNMDNPQIAHFKVFSSYKYDSFYNRKTKRIFMIAGGTGITPMYQLLSDILFLEDCDVLIRLLFANKSEDDILLKSELEHMERKHSNKLKINYTIDKANNPQEWKYDIGFITKKMIKEFSFPDKDQSSFTFLLCGPPPMTNANIKILQDLNFEQEQIIKF